MPPDGPAPDLAMMRHGERLLYLAGGAKDHGWRCQWQVENPKGGLSKDRYALYCGAATYAEAIGLGMKPGVKSGDTSSTTTPRGGPTSPPRRAQPLLLLFRSNPH